MATEDQRRAAFAEALQIAAARGGRVESQHELTATIVFGKPLNHVLHLPLSVFTLVWAVVWIYLASKGGEHRQMITIDEYGNILAQNV